MRLCLLILTSLFVLLSCKEGLTGKAYNSTDPRSFEEIWEAYEVQVKLKRENADFKFNPPANLKEVSQWEKILKSKLPEELLELYKLGNGQAEDGQSVIKGFTLMKVVAAARQWQIVESNIAKIKMPTEAKGPVKKEIWNNQWIPFAVDPGGNLLCIDQVPAFGGHKGQIIAVYFEAGIREVVAKSIKDYFIQSEKGLKEGKLGFDAFGVGPIPLNDE